VIKVIGRKESQKGERGRERENKKDNIAYQNVSVGGATSSRGG
jgi:hypothetical protein